MKRFGGSTISQQNFAVPFMLNIIENCSDPIQLRKHSISLNEVNFSFPLKNQKNQSINQSIIKLLTMWQSNFSSQIIRLLFNPLSSFLKLRLILDPIIQSELKKTLQIIMLFSFFFYHLISFHFWKKKKKKKNSF